jgi:N-acetylmuramoyl-L-alanine amidase
VAFAPVSGNRHRTVFLDPGHGGPDPGGLGVTTSGKPIAEKTETLATVRDATQLLRADGYRVVVSRTADTAVALLPGGGRSRTGMSASAEHKDLLARVRCANLAGAAALVSVHFNVDGHRSTRGASTFFDAARPFSSSNRTLAVLLQRNIFAALAAHGGHAPDRGATSNSTGGGALTAASVAYGHLLVIGPYKQGYNDHPSAMPGALVEPLFISNPPDGSLADSATGRHAIATGIARALEQFLAG